MKYKTHALRTMVRWIFASALAIQAVVLAQGAEQKEPIQVSLLSQRDQVRPGDTVWLGLSFELDPEWHLYWVNPGAAGFPPSVTWNTGPGLAVDGLRFPMPKLFKSGGLPGYGYEKSLLLLAPARVASDASGEILIKAKVEWLACDPKSCVPGEAEVSLTLRVGQTATPSRAEIDAAIASLPETSAWKMTAGLKEEERQLRLQIEPEREPFPAESLDFYVEQPGVVDPAVPVAFRWEGNTLSGTAALAKEFQGELPPLISGLLHSRDSTVEKPLLLSTDASSGAGPQAGKTAQPSAGTGKEADSAKTAAGDGWGSWLQRPLVVAGLAALMFLIGLNLMGVFEVGVGLTGAGSQLNRTEGLAGSFFSGGLATVVATPCTAPFMGSAIFYALGQAPLVTLLIFTFLGLGMAAPYLVLSRYPRLIEQLPKPGAWMETLKQGLAFPMFAVVIWLIWVLSFQVSQNGLLAVLGGLLLLGLAAWWFGRFGTLMAGKRVRLAAQVGPMALTALALFWGVRAGEERLPAKSMDVEAQIQQIQASGKGVFVDFTAAWCLTCQANKAAMHSERVQAAFAEKGVEFLEVDWTQKDPEIYRVLQKYGRAGVPLYLLFPAGSSGSPQVLPNVLTEGIILDALRSSGGGSAGPARDYGLWGALLGALLGGLILNLMPCVFPVVSLKILGFVKQAGSDRKRIWHHGLAFGAGVLTFFWLLALLLLGAKAGFGS